MVLISSGIVFSVEGDLLITTASEKKSDRNLETSFGLSTNLYAIFELRLQVHRYFAHQDRDASPFPTPSLTSRRPFRIV